MSPVFRCERLAHPPRTGIDKGRSTGILRRMADRMRTRSKEDDKPSRRQRVELELDRSFRGPLLAYFSKRVGNRSEAEDLTQEVFIRLLHHPDKNDGRTLDGYVFTIAANLLRDRAKSVAAANDRQARSLDMLVEEEAFSANLVEDRNPERVLVGRQTIQDVLEALAELGDRTRDVFILARLENIQHREIAAMYGISVSAVEKAMMKAMAHLGARFLQP
jgi:RNA polymerase sigma factor (sigma-70 family)